MLIISFSRPIILPPIRIDPIESTKKRLLSDKNIEIDIKDVIGLRVASSFYEKGSEEINIDDYYLTKIDERTLDIQIDFQKPLRITQSIKEPDSL